jgi:hypothetical protein
VHEYTAYDLAGFLNKKVNSAKYLHTRIHILYFSSTETHRKPWISTKLVPCQSDPDLIVLSVYGPSEAHCCSLAIACIAQSELVLCLAPHCGT